jgi:hypothetical protein
VSFTRGDPDRYHFDQAEFRFGVEKLMREDERTLQKRRGNGPSCTSHDHHDNNMIISHLGHGARIPMNANSNSILSNIFFSSDDGRLAVDLI